MSSVYAFSNSITFISLIIFSSSIFSDSNFSLSFNSGLRNLCLFQRKCSPVSATLPINSSLNLNGYIEFLSPSSTRAFLLRFDSLIRILLWLEWATLSFLRIDRTTFYVFHLYVALETVYQIRLAGLYLFYELR